jgi:hypothetical protein
MLIPLMHKSSPFTANDIGMQDPPSGGCRYLKYWTFANHHLVSQVSGNSPLFPLSNVHRASIPSHPHPITMSMCSFPSDVRCLVRLTPPLHGNDTPDLLRRACRERANDTAGTYTTHTTVSPQLRLSTTLSPLAGPPSSPSRTSNFPPLPYPSFCATQLSLPSGVPCLVVLLAQASHQDQRDGQSMQGGTHTMRTEKHHIANTSAGRRRAAGRYGRFLLLSPCLRCLRCLLSPFHLPPPLCAAFPILPLLCGADVTDAQLHCAPIWSK